MLREGLDIGMLVGRGWFLLRDDLIEEIQLALVPYIYERREGGGDLPIEVCQSKIR